MEQSSGSAAHGTAVTPEQDFSAGPQELELSGEQLRVSGWQDWHDLSLRAGQSGAVRRQECSSRDWQNPPEHPLEATEVSSGVTPAAHSEN